MKAPLSMRAALAGAFALAAAVGIGRFAYTALLPATQLGLAFDDAAAGAIASANLLGYLAGAVAGRNLAVATSRGRALRAALASVVLSMALLALASSPWSWAALRFVAGVGGGIVFVLVSAAALEPREGEQPRPGVLYSGVGAGMAITGATAALLPLPAWRTAWLTVATIAAMAAVPAWYVLTAAPVAPVARASPRSFPRPAQRPPFSLSRLAVAYFLEALGYIVSGTFAVLAVRRTPGLERLAPWTWTLAGVAAAPSALLWSMLGRRVGVRPALVTAFLAQAAGMAIPSLSSSATGALVGASVFGGTFMGIAALTMSAAQAIAPARFAHTVGTLTAVYGIGQIAGPVAAGALSSRLGDPRPAVLAAAVAVAMGGILLAWPSSRSPSGGSPQSSGECAACRSRDL